MTAQATLNPHQTRSRVGKYLTFMLDSECYGLELQKVREIVAMMDITPVPRTQPFIRGVVNLRGRVVPVMDLRRKFDMPSATPGALACIIVVDLGKNEMGIMVDQMCDVLEITDAEIEDAPALAAETDAGFLLGIGMTGSKVTILLDIEKTLSPSETTHLCDIAHNTIEGESTCSHARN